MAFGGKEPPGEESDGGALDIALDAGDLSGESDRRPGLQAELQIQKSWTVDETVPMKPAEPREGRVFQPGDHAENPGLFSIFQLRLEPHHVEQATECVVLTELDHGMG